MQLLWKKYNGLNNISDSSNILECFDLFKFSLLLREKKRDKFIIIIVMTQTTEE